MESTKAESVDLKTGVTEGGPSLHDSLGEVSEILEALSAKALFIVADPMAYELSGAKDTLAKDLASREVTLFQDFKPNPYLDEVVEGIELYKNANPDVVLAIGGGTAIDLAKLIGFCAVQTKSPRELILSPVSHPQPTLPLIAVPTTAGTGSR